MECPVCFSPAEPAVRESMNIGILVLLGATTAVLTCFARFFLTLARRSRTAAHLVQHTEHVGAGFSNNVGAGFSRPAVGLKADATS
jgi:hypothetical protein